MRRTLLWFAPLIMVVGIATTACESARDERTWRAAVQADSTANYQDYLAAWPQGRHTAEAIGRIDALAWSEAVTAGTVHAIRDYLSAHPGGWHVNEAVLCMDSLLTDEAPFEAAQHEGTPEALAAFVQNFPGHRREAIAAALMAELEGRGFFTLLSDRRIRATVSGSGIESIDVQLQRRTDDPVTVRIPMGTMFLPRDDSVQRMVATSDAVVTLSDTAWVSVFVPVACADKDLDVPGEDDGFRIVRPSPQSELSALIPILAGVGVSSYVTQAAVWIVSDDADYDGLGTLVSRSAFSLFGGTRVIEADMAVEAMRLIEEAGLRIREHSIWEDRRYLYTMLADTTNQEWLCSNDPETAERIRSVNIRGTRASAATAAADLDSLRAHPLSIHIGIGEESRWAEAAWLAGYLRGLGHSVTVDNYRYWDRGVVCLSGSRIAARTIAGIMRRVTGQVFSLQDVESEEMLFDIDITIY